jgi:hypothetical protein
MKRLQRILHATGRFLARPKRVDPYGDHVAAARSLVTIFGDEKE